MVSSCGAALLGAGTDLDGSVFVAVLRFWVGVIGRKEFVWTYVCVWASGGKGIRVSLQFNGKQVPTILRI